MRRWGIYQSNDNKSHRVKNHIDMVDLDIVKSMTDLCDGGALITVMILNPFDANGHH